MKKYTRLIVLGLGAVVVLATASLTDSFAQTSTLSEDHLARIRTSCVTAKNTLSQLHASDALLRVNRGQIYESMTTKLMSRFNARVDSNRYEVKDFSSVTDSYGLALTKFRTDYQAYEEQLSSALKIDCAKDPLSFYNSVASARTKRTQVRTDIIVLHKYIDDYKITFDSFVTNTLSGTGGNR